MGMHDGHRLRLKHRFAVGGLDSLSDINILELLLFYAIPRRDTNLLAHALIDHFGSLDAVFDADMDELQTVPGIGKTAAEVIMLVRRVMYKYQYYRMAVQEDWAFAVSKDGKDADESTDTE